MEAPTNAAHALLLDAALCFQSFDPEEFQRQYEAHVRALDYLIAFGDDEEESQFDDVPEFEPFDDAVGESDEEDEDEDE